MSPRDRRSLPSPGTCLALLALFVSLGGTTYAVTSLPRDSVGTAQLRDRAVTEDKLSRASVITRKLANGSVTARKLAREGITGSRIAPDALGGDQIDESLLGAVPNARNAEQAKIAIRAAVADRVERVERAETAGSADTAKLAERAAEADRAGHADQADVAARLAAVDLNFISATVPEGDWNVFVIECDAGQDVIAINGGFAPSDDFDDLPAISGSAPVSDTSWVVVVTDRDADAGGSDTSGFAYVVCIPAEAAS